MKDAHMQLASRQRGCLLGLACGDAEGTTVEFCPRGCEPVTDMVGGGPFGIKAGDPFSGSTDQYSAGNGSIMRLAPVPMFFHTEPAEGVRWSGESSRTTHAAPECIESCQLLP